MVKLGPFALDATLTSPDGGRVVAALRLESPAQATDRPPVPASAAPATEGNPAPTSAPRPAGASLRDTMPQTAAVVDWMRSFLGRQAADRVIARGRAGHGGAYFAEIGPDGQLREFGSTTDGRRWAIVGGAPRWVDRAGAPIDAQGVDSAA